MRDQIGDFFIVNIKRMFNIARNIITVLFFNPRDLFFMISVKHIKFRKDIAEFLVDEIELNKSDAVMYDPSNYHKYNSTRNCSDKGI